METYFNDYFKALQDMPLEEITEHSHRGKLETLLNVIASKQKHLLKILHEPKRKAGFGAPDFKVTSLGNIVGYVENKKIEEKLSKTLKTEQIKKYQALNDNILLTNYIEFVWLKNGETTTEILCSEIDVQNRKAKLNPERVDAVEALIIKFFSQPPKQIGNAKKLAEALAVRAKYLKDFLKEELEHQQEESNRDKLFGLYETFKEFVFHELTIDEFADAFAQTLAYGLFLAKLNAEAKQVTLLNAKEFIPHSFELIKELVDFLDELKNLRYSSTKWIVEEVLTIMNNLDLSEIQRSLFYRSSKTTDLFNETSYSFKDPFVYFYEDFLAAYDKALRKAKGVYYTPPPIVNFIVRAIDDILQKEFNIKDGLADMNKVTVLDFATGTGTFLVDIIQRIIEKAPAKTAERRLLVKEHILKNLYGFEYLIAPYTIAHLKLSQYLKDAGYPLENGERLQVYLTNTLEPANRQTRIPLLPALSEETRKAQEIKDKKILVITGNPPYAGHSKNPSEHKVYLSKGSRYNKRYTWNTSTNKVEPIQSVASKEGDYTLKTWIGEKLMDYFFVDGKPLGERNPKWLQDDYVKFIRFAQDKIDNEDEGIVGIITNHSFLDNPTFRGMRQSLMNSFDQMYFIDLHGNNKKKEKTPEGKRDENVFDIEQGVAISILIKKKGLEKKIFHTDWWGTREVKYRNGWEEELKNVKWSDINNSNFNYQLKPQNEELFVLYKKNLSVKDIFIKSSIAVQTHRDDFAIAFTQNDLLKRISDLKNNKISDKDFAVEYNLKESSTFNIHDLRQEAADLEKDILDYAYRPFDIRKIIFDDLIVDRTRRLIASNITYDNYCLNCCRLINSNLFAHTLISQNVSDSCLLSTQTKEGAYMFPLYILKNGTDIIFFKETPNEVHEPQTAYKKGDDVFHKVENLITSFRKYIDDIYKHHFNPEQILSYIYAILHSPTYRSKYAEFLKIDFPRIPFPEDKSLFQQLSDLGWQLIQAHLIQKDVLNNIEENVQCTDNGNYEIEKPVFNNNKLFINKQQYFHPVSREVYDFYIGGYQVLDKYLKDRKGRKLGLLEVKHVTNIIKVIGFTIEQMEKINHLTTSWI